MCGAQFVVLLYFLFEGLSHYTWFFRVYLTILGGFRSKSVCFVSKVLGRVRACARGLILGLPSQIGNPAQNLDFGCSFDRLS